MKINRIKNYLNKFVFVLPSIILISGFTLYPLIFAFINSFKRYKLTQPNNIKFIGFENYIEIFKQKEFIEALIRTIGLTMLLVIVELLIGIIIAIVLSDSFKGHGIIRSILILPIAATPVIVGLTWKLMYDPRVGVINYLLNIIGIKGPLWLAYSNWALLAVIVMDVWQWTPFMVIILLAGILGQPKDLFEAALVDGANRYRVITKITIPLLKKVMGVAILIRASDVFRLFDQIWMLTRGGPGTATETLTVHIYRTGFSYFEIGKASAMSFIMLIIMMIFIIFAIKKINLLEET